MCCPLVRLPRRHVTVLASLLGLLALLLLPAAPASAATAGWADVTFEGSANDWTGTLRQRAEGFPAATITSDSAGGSAVGRQSGALDVPAGRRPTWAGATGRAGGGRT